MVALVELELELDAREERRRRMEDEPVRPGGDVGELPDAPVAVRLAGGDELVAAEELDEHACRGPAIRRVEDVGGEHQANLLAWTRWARAISSSSARTRAPSRTTSWPPTYSRSTRCGAERTSPATGSEAPPSSSPSVRQTARSARLPGSSEPISVRPSTAAPPRVPIRSASRTVIAVGPPRPRATRSACFTSKRRSPRSLDAEPSTPRPMRTPASSMSRTGATPAPRRRFDVGQCATPVPVRANCAISVPERCTQWAHQTSPASQPSDSRYSTGEQPYSSLQ